MFLSTVEFYSNTKWSIFDILKYTMSQLLKTLYNLVKFFTLIQEVKAVWKSAQGQFWKAEKEQIFKVSLLLELDKVMTKLWRILKSGTFLWTKSEHLKKNSGIFSFLILICSLSNITIFWVAINIFIISGPPSNSPVSSGTREIQNYFLIFKILMIGTFTIHMTRNWW